MKYYHGPFMKNNLEYIKYLSNKKVLTKKDLNSVDLLEFDIDKRVINNGRPRQILWHIINQTKSPPKCKNKDCQQELEWVPDQNKYRMYCSHKCRASCDDYKQNQINNNIKKYGVKSNLLLPQVQEKVKESNRSNYGVDYIFQNSDIRDRAEKSRKSKYSKEKLNNTLKERYGVNSISHIRISKESLDILLNKDKFKALIEEYSPQGIANKLKVDRNTIIRYCGIYNIEPNKYLSSLEVDMKLFLERLSIEFIQNEKNIITPYELDFYLPDYNLAIEMNGDYWHSEKYKDRFYHFNKWKKCKEKGINLISIFETEWYNKRDIIENIIKNKLNLNTENKIHGRKFEIRRITTSEYRSIVEKYHIQGFVSGIIYYGCFYNNVLRAAMCFSYTRGSKFSRRFELRRWVTDFGIYPGLFSKTFNFAKKDLGFNTVVSFSDNRWFSGESYEKIGFTKGRIYNPNYYYVYNGDIVHCSRFTKKNILTKFFETDFSECNTESEMMSKLGIPKIWDCGKQEWIYE